MATPRVAVGREHLLHRAVGDEVARGGPPVAGHDHAVGVADGDDGGAVGDVGPVASRRRSPQRGSAPARRSTSTNDGPGSSSARKVGRVIAAEAIGSSRPIARHAAEVPAAARAAPDRRGTDRAPGCTTGRGSPGCAGLVAVIEVQAGVRSGRRRRWRTRRPARSAARRTRRPRSRTSAGSTRPRLRFRSATSFAAERRCAQVRRCHARPADRARDRVVPALRARAGLHSDADRRQPASGRSRRRRTRSAAASDTRSIVRDLSSEGVTLSLEAIGDVTRRPSGRRT